MNPMPTEECCGQGCDVCQPTNERTAMDNDQDAKRYRWLRTNWDNISGLTWREPIAEKLDAHIDAELAKAEKPSAGNVSPKGD